jgi:glycine cleavage system H protein
MNEHQKNYSVIPDGEFRCVWMSAGILSYQLCNQSYDCDACPLDAAMRQHFPRPDTHPESADRAPSTPPGDEVEFREQYSYTSNHFWVKSIAKSLYRVGIEPFLSRAFLIPRTIILPEVGETVTTSQPCLWFVLDEKTIPIHAPADGVVIAHNNLLSERPYKVYYHPYDQGWLFDLKITAEKQTHFLNTSAARLQFRHDQQLFREQLKDALHSASTGVTLPDGGQLLQDIPAMLGPKRYFDLVWEVFLNKKRTTKS